MAEYSPHSKVSPQWLQFEEEFPQLKDLDKVGIVRRREIFTETEATIPPRQTPEDVNDSTVTVREFKVSARDGHEIPVRSYIPTSGSSSSRPLLVYLHAGGFLFGDLESGDLNCRVLSTRLNISILNVGYRLAPAWKFPNGLNDCYDAVEWAATHGEAELSASPSTSFIVGGISSGANLAAVVAYQARDAGLSPPITGLWISIGVGLMPQAYHLVPEAWKEQLLSLDQNAENPLLTKTSLAQIEDLYGAPPSDPRISFLLNENHGGLAQRAYFQICGWDPLRDELFLFQKLLHAHSGTQSKVHLYSGLPHGFWRFLAMPASLGWLDDLVDGVRFVIEQDGGAESAGEQKDGATVVVKGL